jgi:hypothetical protein
MLCAPVQGALGKVDGFSAFCAGVVLLEFVGKNFLALSAFRTFADKGFQVLEVLVTGAMLGCGHNSLLFLDPD